jgi:hypothetical protein
MVSGNGTSAVALLVFLAIIVLAPIGLIILTFPAEPYRLVTGEPVREAALATGIRVINTSDVTWTVPGALGGKSYLLEDENGNTLTIQTQKFDSSQSRDAAVVAFSTRSVGKGQTVGTMFVSGDYGIFAGPDPGGILKRIGTELKMRVGAE